MTAPAKAGDTTAALETTKSLEAFHTRRKQCGQTGTSSGMEPMGRWLVWGAGSFPALAALAGGMVGVSAEALKWTGVCGRGIWCGLLSKALAKAFAVVLASGSLHATVLGLGAARDAAGASEVSDVEVEENREVRGPITWREPNVYVVKLVASKLMDSCTGAGA